MHVDLLMEAAAREVGAGELEVKLLLGRVFEGRGIC